MEQYPDEFNIIIEYLETQELEEELITTIGDELFVHLKNSKYRFITIEVQNSKLTNLLNAKLQDVTIWWNYPMIKNILMF